jgi:hypothetical protein
MTEPVIHEWAGRVFGFSVTGCDGKVQLREEGTLMREVVIQIGEEKISLGTLVAHHKDGEPDTVTFSAFGAAPNIRFKFRGTEAMRQVPMPLISDTAFYIICAENIVKAVMVVEQ